FTRTVGDSVVGDDIVGQHFGGFFEEFHAPGNVAGDLVDVLAIGSDAALGLGHGGFTIEQRIARGLRLVLADGHHAHRQAPAADDGDREARRSYLHPRADGDEADLTL